LVTVIVNRSRGPGSRVTLDVAARLNAPLILNGVNAADVFGADDEEQADATIANAISASGDAG
jgi:molybdate-binding protein